MKKSLHLLTVLLLPLAASAAELLSDNFSGERPDLWEQLPAGAGFSEGHLRLPAVSGQVSLASIEPFENAQATLDFSVSKTGTGDTIFYYLGFQTVQPWMADAFYVMIQDTALVVCVVRAGEQTATLTVPDVAIEAGRDYQLVLRREAARLEVSFDGRTVYTLEDAEKIPAGPLQLFFAANTFEKDAEPEVLSLKSAVVESL